MAIIQAIANIIFFLDFSLFKKYTESTANKSAKLYPNAVYGYINVKEIVGVTTNKMLIAIFIYAFFTFKVSIKYIAEKPITIKDNTVVKIETTILPLNISENGIKNLPSDISHPFVSIEP